MFVRDIADFFSLIEDADSNYAATEESEFLDNLEYRYGQFGEDTQIAPAEFRFLVWLANGRLYKQQRLAV